MSSPGSTGTALSIVRSARDARGSSDVVSHHVNRDTDGRLNHADDQHSNIFATPPEFPTQDRDDGSSHEENQEEAEDVIPIVDVGAERSRREKMAQEANHDQ